MTPSTPSYGAVRRVRDRFRARRDGKRDGMLGIPTRDEVAFPPALLQIKQRGDEALAALSRGWATDEARIREAGAATRLEAGTVERDVDAAAREVASAKERHAAIAERRETIAGQSPSSGTHLNEGVYAVAIVAIFLAEFPLNAIAFRLFGEAEVLTWIMTASLALTLVMCAHGLGTFLRIVQPTMAERRWIVVLIALPALTIIAIAVIRSRYLSATAELTGLDVLSPVVGSFVFLVINLLVYTGATMLSYLAHAPRVPGARRAEEAFEDSRKELVAAQARLAEISRRMRAEHEQQSRASVEPERALRVARARARELVSYYGQLMAAYCAANLRARGNPEVPAVLRTLPSLEVPDVLEEARTSTGSAGNGHPSAATVAALGGAREPEVSR